MAADSRWTDGPQDFTFAACSGATTGDMVINYRGNFGSADNPVGQITYAGAPSVLTMQVGGNNCGFAGVVESCLVQPYPLTDYGAAYPDPTGSCAQGLANVTDVIEG